MGRERKEFRQIIDSDNCYCGKKKKRFPFCWSCNSRIPNHLRIDLRSRDKKIALEAYDTAVNHLEG